MKSQIDPKADPWCISQLTLTKSDKHLSYSIH